MSRKYFHLTVINQSHSEIFQDMISQIAIEFGPVLLLSGRNIPSHSTDLVVERLPEYDRGRIHRRAFSWLRFVLSTCYRLIFSRDKSFVLAVSNPPMNAHLAWVLSRFNGRRYGLLIWDIYPDALTRNGMLKKSSILNRLWKSSHATCMARADFVVTIGDRMKEVLRAQLGVQARATRIDVIPNWVDTMAIKPVDRISNPFCLEHELTDKTIIMYSGNIGAGHGVDILPAAAENFRSQNDIIFLVIGSGLGSGALLAEIDRRGLENMRLLPYQPAEVFPLSSAAADIAVIFQRPGTEDISMPSKTYTALAAGSAVLAVTKPDSDLARLVEGKDVGIVVDYAPDAIAGGLLRLLDDPKRLRQMRANARHVAVTEYDTHVVKEQWLRLLRDNIGRGEGAKA